MVGIRSEIRGAPGGRTRYPITMRRIKLEAAIDVKAIIRITGLIVGGNSRTSNVHSAGFVHFLTRFHPAPVPKSLGLTRSLNQRRQANQIGMGRQNYFVPRNKIESGRR